MSNSFPKMEELQREHVHIRNREKVLNILKDIIDGGPSKLQVVADFDRTLSGYKINGRLVDTCHNTLDDSKHLPQAYREQAIELRNTYYPIEIDPHKTKEEKYPHMVQWWTRAHDLLLRHCTKLTRSLLSQIVGDAYIRLRAGCDWLFNELDRHQIPLLIFSAGIGNIIEETIRQQSTFHDNIKIVSNFLEFDSDGNVVGFQGDIIHVYNKNENAIHDSDYFSNLSHRENVLLMGDSLGDLHMADGASDAQHVLKIGFLNDQVEKKLEMYTEAYDIVLVTDETLDIPNAILRHILQSS